MGQFASLAQPVDSRVKAKMADLMDEGVSKVSEMKRHIHIFSKNELLPSSDTTASSISRRFHPTDKDVRNYMALHKQKSRNIDRIPDELLRNGYVALDAGNCPRKSIFKAMSILL